MDPVWNLLDLANGALVIGVHPSLLWCAEAASYYMETIRVHLACYPAYLA